MGYPQNGSTHSYFVGDGKLRFCKVGELLGHPVKEGQTHIIAAPTISNILDWLRNNKDIHVNLRLSKEYEEDGNWNGERIHLLSKLEKRKKWSLC